MFSVLYDLIFPKRCVGCNNLGSYLCDNCLSTIDISPFPTCPMCLGYSRIGKTHLSCIKGFYLDGISYGVVGKGVVKKLLNRFTNRPFLIDLASIISKIFIESMSQNELFMRTLSSHPIVIVVPLSQKEVKKRGYNSAELLARRLAKDFSLKFVPNLLIKMKSSNFDFSPKYKNLAVGKTIILIHDSSSIGDLRECARVLKRNGVFQVYGVVFAKTL